MPLSYKGYRIGSIERSVLQLLLGVKDAELPSGHAGETFSAIFKTARQKTEFSNIFHKLKEKKLLDFKNKGGQVRVSLTDAGRKAAEKIMFETIDRPRTQKVWDHKWRVVIFDIPERRRQARNALRLHLKRFGFLQIQASVWAYPFPCEDIVAIIKTYFELGDEVLFMTVETLEGDIYLKKKFKLS